MLQLKACGSVSHLPWQHPAGPGGRCWPPCTSAQGSAGAANAPAPDGRGTLSAACSSLHRPSLPQHLQDARSLRSRSAAWSGDPVKIALPCISRGWQAACRCTPQGVLGTAGHAAAESHWSVACTEWYPSVASSPPVYSAAHPLQGCQLLLAPDQLLLPGQLLLACSLVWQADSCGRHQPRAEPRHRGPLRELQVPRDRTVNCRQSLAGRGRCCTHRGRESLLAIVSAAGH